MNNWDTMMLKRKIFELFENVRILYNDYYRIDRDFTKDDIEAIKMLMELVGYNTKEAKEMIKNV